MAKHHKISLKRHKNFKKIVMIFLVVLVIGLIIAFVPSSVLSKEKVAATVNGEKIYQKRVDAIFNSQPRGSNLTKKEIVDRLIETKLLVDYIKNGNFNISEKQIDDTLNQQLKEAFATLQDLERDLLLRGETVDDVKDTMRIEIFMKQIILPNITLPNEEVTERVASTNNTIKRDTAKRQLFLEKQIAAIANIVENERNISTIVISKEYR